MRRDLLPIVQRGIVSNIGEVDLPFREYAVTVENVDLDIAGTIRFLDGYKKEWSGALAPIVCLVNFQTHTGISALVWAGGGSIWVSEIAPPEGDNKADGGV